MPLDQIPIKEMENEQLLQAMCIWYSRYQKLGTDYYKYLECLNEAKSRMN